MKNNIIIINGPNLNLLGQREQKEYGNTTFDDVSQAVNPVKSSLIANSSGAKATENSMDFLSNGFKLRTSGNGHNTSGDTYLYMAFAQNPFVNSNGTPSNAH